MDVFLHRLNMTKVKSLSLKELAELKLVVKNPFIYAGLAYHETTNNPHFFKSDIHLLAKWIAEEFEITVEQLTCKNRIREYTFPRQILFYFIKKYSVLSLKVIGQVVGKLNSNTNINWDHATVLHSIRLVDSLIDIKDKKSCSVIQKIEGRINSEFLNIRNLADIEKTN